MFLNDTEALCETREWVGIKLFKEGFEQSAIPIIQKVIDAMRSYNIDRNCLSAMQR